jgi:hypothetical protein
MYSFRESRSPPVLSLIQSRHLIKPRWRFFVFIGVIFHVPFLFFLLFRVSRRRIWVGFSFLPFFLSICLPYVSEFDQHVINKNPENNGTCCRVSPDESFFNQNRFGCNLRTCFAPPLNFGMKS